MQERFSWMDDVFSQTYLLFQKSHIMYHFPRAVTGYFLLRIQNTGKPTHGLCLRFATTHKEEQGGFQSSHTPDPATFVNNG